MARGPGLTAWLVTAFGDERQYAGNTGYADETTSIYRYDSNVPNHRRVQTGDLLVIRDRKHIVGVARVETLDKVAGRKTLNLCPACHRSGLKRRKQLSPQYRCQVCSHEFDTPGEKVVDVTNYVARFGDSFRTCSLPLDISRIREACTTYNGQHAIQALSLDALQAYGKPLQDVAQQILRRRDDDLPGPTADPLELERRVARILARGPVSRPRGQAAPPRVASVGGFSFMRDPAVKAWVLQEAQGTCESCTEPGPFELAAGTRFLEVHHVIPLADGGPDVVENAVAVCPNCHRALHLASDRTERLAALRAAVRRLQGSR